MQLTNYSRIGIVGGGPSGSLTAYFLLENAKRLGIQLIVEIYEPSHFSAKGPKGCNHCGGIVSETVVQLLATDGINLPPHVVQRGIDSYVLHTDHGDARIQTPLAEMRIASLFRGSGPLTARDDSAVSYESFDGFLLSLALGNGARHIPQRVDHVLLDDGWPVIHTKGGEARKYDLVVGAVGVNGGGPKIFEKTGIRFVPPQTVSAFITEVYLGQEAIHRKFGNAMHVFLIKLPGVHFAALVPKGEFVTAVILGNTLNKDTADLFLNHPTVKKCFPEGTDLAGKMCRCLPKVNIGSASPLFADRVVMVGDAGVSRLYKDGIGAAYRTAKLCATTAIVHGVSRHAFRRFYQPLCRSLDLDNRIGKTVFLTIDLFKWLPFLTRGMLRMVRRENEPSSLKKPLSMILWDTFTGSNSYWSIFVRCLAPRFLFHLAWESLLSMFPEQWQPGPKSKVMP